LSKPLGVERLADSQLLPSKFDDVPVFAQ
jgi:hypothetical protein